MIDTVRSHSKDEGRSVKRRETTDERIPDNPRFDDEFALSIPLEAISKLPNCWKGSPRYTKKLLGIL